MWLIWHSIILFKFSFAIFQYKLWYYYWLKHIFIANFPLITVHLCYRMCKHFVIYILHRIAVVPYPRETNVFKMSHVSCFQFTFILSACRLKARLQYYTKYKTISTLLDMKAESCWCGRISSFPLGVFFCLSSTTSVFR